jgi:L-asparaginase
MTLPRVLVIATGGTLAGISDDPLATTGYRDAALGVDDMLRAIPGAQTIAKLTTMQFSKLGSENITSDHLMALTRLVNSTITSGEADGIVITHGSDTLEETAFFLDVTYNGRNPVVLVAAMRPATALSADGPFNLMQAIALAASPSSYDRGVLLTWSNRISSATYTTKASNRAVDAFTAPDQGYLGIFMDLTPQYYFMAARCPNRPYIDLWGKCFVASSSLNLPKVVILYGHQDMDVNILRLVFSQGLAAGAVVACTGDGTLPPAWVEAAQELAAQGIPVVQSSRVISSYVSPRANTLTAGHYSPVKARIILQLSLMLGLSRSDIQMLFDPAAAKT